MIYFYLSTIQQIMQRPLSSLLGQRSAAAMALRLRSFTLVLKVKIRLLMSVRQLFTTSRGTNLFPHPCCETAKPLKMTFPISFCGWLSTCRWGGGWGVNELHQQTCCSSNSSSVNTVAICRACRRGQVQHTHGGGS